MSAFQASHVSVGTSPTVLVSGLEGRYQIIVELPSDFSGEQVWIGGSSVSSSNGFLLEYSDTAGAQAPLAKVAMDVLLDSTDELYAVASTTNVPVALMVNPR